MDTRTCHSDGISIQRVWQSSVCCTREAADTHRRRCALGLKSSSYLTQSEPLDIEDSATERGPPWNVIQGSNRRILGSYVDLCASTSLLLSVTSALPGAFIYRALSLFLVCKRYWLLLLITSLWLHLLLRLLLLLLELVRWLLLLFGVLLLLLWLLLTSFSLGTLFDQRDSLWFCWRRSIFHQSLLACCFLCVYLCSSFFHSNVLLLELLFGLRLLGRALATLFTRCLGGLSPFNERLGSICLQGRIQPLLLALPFLH